MDHPDVFWGHQRHASELLGSRRKAQRTMSELERVKATRSGLPLDGGCEKWFKK